MKIQFAENLCQIGFIASSDPKQDAANYNSSKIFWLLWRTCSYENSSPKIEAKDGASQFQSLSIVFVCDKECAEISYFNFDLKNKGP
jgi:hypothetical protein